MHILYHCNELIILHEVTLYMVITRIQ